MTRSDLRQTLKQLYSPSPKVVGLVDVPELPFLMLDGAGNPNTAPAYAEAIEALYSVSYTLKFMLKRGPAMLDYTVMPLEGLWWAEDMAAFTLLDKDAWHWTMMIAQPEAITEELAQQAGAQATQKKAAAALVRLWLE